MGVYFVADSYKGCDRVGEPFDKNGKPYTKIKVTCDRCTRGVYAVGVCNGELVPHPVANGVCFKCGGTGFVFDEVRLYTEKEKAALDRARDKRLERKETLIRERAAEERKNWLSQNMFDLTTESTFSVVGDSYSIKGDLKTVGCKYDGVLGWHTNNPEAFATLPYTVKTVEIKAEDIIDFSYDGKGYYKVSAAGTVKKLQSEQEEPSKSNWIGKEKEKIEDLPVTVDKISGFSSRYGWTQVYTFKNEENIITWFTAKDLEIAIGEKLFLSGTIKKLDTYNNNPQTVMTRCKIKSR